MVPDWSFGGFINFAVCWIILKYPEKACLRVLESSNLIWLRNYHLKVDYFSVKSAFLNCCLRHPSDIF